MSLWTVDEAAAFLKLEPATVREKARMGKLPALRYGREWRFEQEKLLQAGEQKVTCPSIVIQSPRIGGAASRSAVARFASRQERKTDATQRNTNTSSALPTGVKLSLVKNTTHGKKPQSVGFESGQESEVSSATNESSASTASSIP